MKQSATSRKIHDSKVYGISIHYIWMVFSRYRLYTLVNEVKNSAWTRLRPLKIILENIRRYKIVFLSSCDSVLLQCHTKNCRLSVRIEWTNSWPHPTRQSPQTTKWLYNTLNGRCDEFFALAFSHESSFVGPLIILVTPYRICSKIREDIRQLR